MFGERLSEIRKDHGHTQADLANLLHVSVYSISAYEQGKTWPTLGTLRNICRIYKVSSDYLLDLTDDYGPDYKSNRLTSEEQAKLKEYERFLLFCRENK